MNLEKIVSRLHYRTEIEQAVLQKIRKDKKLIEKLQEPHIMGKIFILLYVSVCR